MHVSSISTVTRVSTASRSCCRTLLLAIPLLAFSFADPGWAQEAVPVDPLSSGQGRFGQPPSSSVRLNDITELKRLADAGNGIAQNNLAYRYLRGEEVSPDLQQSRELFMAAAAQGVAAAEYNLGMLYERGLGVPQDYVAAAWHYQVAAEKGHALAQGRIGLLYENGWGVPQSNSEAMKWFRSAAEHGEASAQCRLGDKFFQGAGLPRDYSEAARWYRRAAEQANAMFRMRKKRTGNHRS